MIELNVALLIWLIVFVTILAFAFWFGINWVSAIALSAIISIIILSLIAPASTLDEMFDEDSNNSLQSLYWAVWVLTGLYLLFYILKKAINDRECNLRKACETLNTKDVHVGSGLGSPGAIPEYMGADWLKV